MARKSEAAAEHHFLQEIFGLLTLALSLILLLSLTTFTWGHPSSNWIGLIGFAIGGALQYLFGLGGYLVVAFSSWAGWRLMVRRPISYFSIRLSLFGIFMISTCLLLSVLSERFPSLGALFHHLCPTATVQVDGPDALLRVRHYLGGMPCYYLYRDLPFINAHKLLGGMGTTLVTLSISFVSFLIITETSVLLLFRRLGRLLWQLSGLLYRGFKALIRRCIPKNQQPASPVTARVVDHSAQIEAPVPVEVLPQAPARRALPAKRKQPTKPPSDYQLPDTALLSTPKRVDRAGLKRDLAKQAEILEKTLESFGIEAKVGQIHCGPTIASFEVHPSTGVKVQKIKTLQSDLALNLQARSLRIIAPIPGKAAVGIEVPTPFAQEVNFREMLSSYASGSQEYELPLLLGQSVSGADVSCDLTRLPHLIIAGATGSGKSVCVNAMIMSLLMNCGPEHVKLLLIDPKKVELTPYSQIPHMIAPVITEPTEAAAALKWLVSEMLRRYELLKQLGFRNITGFNSREIDREAEEGLDFDVPEKLSYIVCIIDELADLMMASSASDIETPITRIAQMARAVGMHLIVATQRPSREVITGLIKANFPARLAFKVASSINSRIILDDTGAETLLGDGDMLFLPPGSASPIRAQGVFVRDADINRVIKHSCRQGPTNYLIESFRQSAGTPSGDEGARDQLYDQAYETVVEARVASTTFLQRKLKIGYARAASIMDQLELDGVIGPQEGSKPRRVLLKKQ